MHLHIIYRTQAQDLQLKTYYTGKPCKNNHFSERYTSNGLCVTCKQEQNNVLLETNYEQVLERSKRWRDNNKEKCSIYAKIYRNNNKKQNKQRDNQYREQNKERIKESDKQYRVDNKEKIKSYNKNYREINKPLYRAAQAKRRSRTKNATPPWEKVELELIKTLYAAAEYLTLLTNRTFHVDHIIPLNHELVCGLHCLDNLQIMLAEDNLSKSNNFEIS